MLVAGPLGSIVKIKAVCASSGKPAGDSLTRGSCSSSSVEGLVARTTEACKALDAFVRTHDAAQKQVSEVQKKEEEVSRLLAQVREVTKDRDGVRQELGALRKAAGAASKLQVATCFKPCLDV